MQLAASATEVSCTSTALAAVQLNLAVAQAHIQSMGYTIQMGITWERSLIAKVALLKSQAAETSQALKSVQGQLQKAHT